MENYQLQFVIHVESSKYREFMNLMTKQLKREKPYGCIDCMICQSIEDNNVFNYTEKWVYLDNLQQHLNSSNFKALKGALKLLTDIRQSHVQLCNDVEEVKLLIA